MAHAKIVLGHFGPWFLRRKLTLSGKALAAHKHVIGASGQGKSFLLAAMMIQYREQGVGFSLIDPHGDLADQVLAHLADRSLIDDKLLYVDFSDHARALPFNYIEQPYPDEDIAEDFVQVCKRVWPSLEGAPLFDTFGWNGAMVAIQNRLPLTEIPRILENQRYRDRLLERVTDSHVVEFFHNNFDHLKEKDRFEEIQSTVRRVRIMTRSPALRYSLGQSENRLDFRRIMDEGMTVIYNLSGLKEEPQALLGALLMRGYESAAQSRSAIDEEARRHHELIVDEFHSFSSKSGKSVETMLSQTRKMKLFATLAHQSWSQTDPSIQGAIQNCRVKIALGLDYSDAVISSRILGRVDTKTISRRDHDESESEGMAEQWQDLIQELQDLPEAEALVRKRLKKLESPWKHLWRRPPSKLYHIESVHVPRPKTGRGKLQQIKDSYAETLTRPLDEVKREIDRSFDVGQASAYSDVPPDPIEPWT